MHTFPRECGGGGERVATLWTSDAESVVSTFHSDVARGASYMGGAVDMRTGYTERTQVRLEFLRRRVRTRRMVRQWLLAGGALAAGALTTATVAIAVFDIDLGGAGSAGGSDGGARQRRLLATEAHDAKCNTTSYPEEDQLFGKGLLKCDTLENGGVMLYALGVLYMFFALAIVCDEYFVPALEALVDRWHVEDDVAGATFMAAGGSAPELFTSFIGCFTESAVGFGTIVGSAVFNVLFVIGVCAIASSKLLHLEWWPLARDCTYYCFGLAMLALFFGYISKDKIEWWEALILLSLYGGYVVLMKYHLVVYKAVCEAIGIPPTTLQPEPHGFVAAGGVMLLLHEKLDLHVERHLVFGPSSTAGDMHAKFDAIDTDGSGKLSKEELKAELMKDPMFAKTPDKEALIGKMLDAADTNGDGEIDKDEFVAWYGHARAKLEKAVETLFREMDLNSDGRIDKYEAEQLMLKADPNLSQEQLDHEWSKMEKLSFTDDAVAERAKTEAAKAAAHSARAQPYVFKASTNAEEEFTDFRTFANWYTEMSSVRGLGLLGDDNDDDEDEGPTTAVGKILYVITFPILMTLKYTLPNCSTEEGKKWGICGFCGSILWIGVFSYFMVWWAAVVGAVAGIDAEVMGLTILAAGTSVPDLISSVIVAQQGKGDMAISSSIGSNIFDILFGLPFPWLCYCIFFGITEKNFKPNEVEADDLITDVLILLAMVLYVILSVMAAGWTMSKMLGMSYFFMYAVFITQKLIRILV